MVPSGAISVRESAGPAAKFAAGEFVERSSPAARKRLAPAPRWPRRSATCAEDDHCALVDDLEIGHLFSFSIMAQSLVN